MNCYRLKGSEMPPFPSPSSQDTQKRIITIPPSLYRDGGDAEEGDAGGAASKPGVLELGCALICWNRVLRFSGHGA